VVEVPTSITLKALHDIVQAAMGWLDYHLWELVIDGQNYGLPMEEDWGTAPRKVASRTNAGSSLKLCLVAEGVADVYPRLGRTMEWDIAAGDAILRAAGGSVRTLDGAPLRYGKPGFANPDFVAAGRAG